MKSTLVLGLAALTALGCAALPAPSLQVPSVLAVAPPKPKGPPPKARSFRLGFWELDLFAIDQDRKATTFRFLDFRVFKLFEFGKGPDYHSVGFVEIPPLFHLFTSRHDGIKGIEEHRFMDLRALAIAPVRVTRERERKATTDVMKIFVLGSAYGYERDGPDERRTIAYLYRQDIEK